MVIIYDDYGGAHSTPVAAALHLGQLPVDRTPSNEELLALPLFDRTTSDTQGCLVFMGQDRDGHDVYVLGRGPGAMVVERALASGVVLAGGAKDGILFVETLPYVNLWMRIGGFLSRAVGLVALGRPLVLYGTRKAFSDFVRLVTAAKRRLTEASADQRCIGSDGHDLGAMCLASVRSGALPGLTERPLQYAPNRTEEE